MRATKTRIRRQSRRTGFTLMEVLLVLVILVILGSMAGLFLRSAQKNALINAARAEMSIFESALELYQTNMLAFPETQEGLRALLEAPQSNQAKWAGPYIKQTNFLDPWGNEYQYERQTADTYIITSAGPDGSVGSEDDIASTDQVR